MKGWWETLTGYFQDSDVSEVVVNGIRSMVVYRTSLVLCIPSVLGPTNLCSLRCRTSRFIPGSSRPISTLGWWS